MVPNHRLSFREWMDYNGLCNRRTGCHLVILGLAEVPETNETLCNKLCILKAALDHSSSLAGVENARDHCQLLRIVPVKMVSRCFWRLI